MTCRSLLVITKCTASSTMFLMIDVLHVNTHKTSTYYTEQYYEHSDEGCTLPFNIYNLNFLWASIFIFTAFADQLFFFFLFLCIAKKIKKNNIRNIEICQDCLDGEMWLRMLA